MVINQIALIQEKKEIKDAAALRRLLKEGKIYGLYVHNELLVVNAIRSEHSWIEGIRFNLSQQQDLFSTGQSLGKKLKKEFLTHVSVFTNDLKFNARDLFAGFTQTFSRKISLAHGSMYDTTNSRESVMLRKGLSKKDEAVAIGLYSHGSNAESRSSNPWQPLGPCRLITEAKKNVVYKIDGYPALNLFRDFGGWPYGSLPLARFLYSLRLFSRQSPRGLLTAVLSFDQKEKSLILAEPVPPRSYCQILKTNAQSVLKEGSSTTNKCRNLIYGSPYVRSRSPSKNGSPTTSVAIDKINPTKKVIGK